MDPMAFIDLTSRIAAVAPVAGVAVADPGDKGTWRVDFLPSATQPQMDAAQAIIDAFVDVVKVPIQTTSFPMFGQDAGEEGPQGPPGQPGTAGAPGSPGATGSAGANGMDGDDGADGADGPPGQPGAAGQTGATGGQGVPAWLEPEQGDEGSIGPPGPTGPAGAAGGGSSATTVEVNLGTVATWRGKFTITDAAISTSSKVLCWQAPGPYTGKGTRADEAELQPVQVIAVEPASGSATVYWQTPPMISVTALHTTGGAGIAGVYTTWGQNRQPQDVAKRIGRVLGNVKFSYTVFA